MPPQRGITSTFNILPSANQGPACQTWKAATKWNYLLKFKFRRKVASRADFSDRFGILENASSWNSFGIGSSQFDDIQIPSEVFPAVVKSASTGCFYRVFKKLSFAKIEHLQILLVIGEKCFWFFVTNPVESVCPLYPVSAKRPIKALNLPIQWQDLPRKAISISHVSLAGSAHA